MKLKDNFKYIVFIIMFLLAIIFIFSDGIIGQIREKFYHSYLIFLFIIVLWIASSYSLAREHEWKKLSSLYKIKYEEKKLLKTKHKKLGSGYIGKIHLVGMYKVKICDKGILINVLFLFYPSHKPILIPWSDILRINIQNIPTPKESTSSFRKEIEVIWNEIYANIKLKSLKEFYLIIPWKREFIGRIPPSVKVEFDEEVDLK